MDTNANAKVFIIKTEYDYAVSPSPVVVPRPKGSLEFENLSDVTAKVTILDKEFTLEPNEKPKSVNLPDGTDRVIYYTVEMTSKLLARGNSAPIIIRDP